MTAKSTKGVKICVVKGGATSVNLSDITAVPNAKPAVITVASTTGIVVGNIIDIPAGATGTSLDGKSWIVGALTATTLTLTGSNTTADTFTAAPTVDVVGYPETDMECLCLASLTFNPEAAQTVSVATFCDPTASIPGAVVGAGTLDFTGFVDTTTTEYAELIKMDADGQERIWRITLPNNGYIMFPGTLATFNWDIPIEGAVGYAGTIALGSKPRHLF